MGLFDKITEKAKNYAKTAKTAIDAATTAVTGPPPELNARQNEIAQKFGYTPKGGESILFTSERADFMATSHAILLTMPDGTRQKAVYRGAEQFSVYFASGYRYARFVRSGAGNYGEWDGVTLPEGEMRAFCQAFLDAYLPGSVAEADLFLRARAGKWAMDTANIRLRRMLEEFSEACGYTLQADEEIIFVANGLDDLILTNKNLLIDMGYHDSVEDDECYMVLGYENSELNFQVTPKFEVIHIVAEPVWYADSLELFKTEARDLLTAFNRYYSGFVTEEQIDQISTGTLRLDLVLGKDKTIRIKENG